ncbi:MAG: macro domain-containing protein [Armatimonadota bacterium]|nr:macro domain-containing protein [Armatimonadota bacterium]
MLFSPKLVYRTHFGVCTVELYHVRYLRHLRADALVLLSNRLLWMGAGVSKRVRDEAGDMVEEEARRYAPLPPGEAVSTSGGLLRVRYIVHANPLNEQLIATPDLLEAALDNALKRCEQLGARQVIFPDFTAQLAGWSASECAQALVQAIERSGGGLQTALIACWQQEHLQAYQQVLISQLSAPKR